jgi:hypothetical protein
MHSLRRFNLLVISSLYSWFFLLWYCLISLRVCGRKFTVNLVKSNRSNTTVQFLSTEELSIAFLAAAGVVKTSWAVAFIPDTVTWHRYAIAWHRYAVTWLHFPKNTWKNLRYWSRDKNTWKVRGFPQPLWRLSHCDVTASLTCVYVRSNMCGFLFFSWI